MHIFIDHKSSQAQLGLCLDSHESELNIRTKLSAYWDPREESSSKLIQALGRLISLWLKRSPFPCWQLAKGHSEFSGHYHMAPFMFKVSNSGKASKHLSDFSSAIKWRKSSAFKGFIWLAWVHQDDLPFD